MFWTLELASHLEDAPWPATKDELIDYSIRSGAPIEVIENLQELEDEGDLYEGLEDIWPDYPSQEDFFFNEDEYWKRFPFLDIRFKAEESKIIKTFRLEKGFFDSKNFYLDNTWNFAETTFTLMLSVPCGVKYFDLKLTVPPGTICS